MINFENQICDVCGKSFDKDSDIVVCPDCGTPHHRRCWMEKGHCANRHKHGEGFEWKPVIKEAAPGESKCSACGRIMPAGTLFCENCGNAMKAPGAPQPAKTMNVPGGTINMYHIPRERDRGRDYRADAFKQQFESRFSGEIDGIPEREMAAYIGFNSQYYVYKFRRMDADKKYKPFNWTACFFTPLWFLFRKMWPMAIATFIFNIVISIPSMIILYVQMGILPRNTPYMFTGIETVSSIMGIVAIVSSVLFGFLAIPMYRKDTVKRINKLKEQAKGDLRMYYTMLVGQSGPSKIGIIAVALFVAYVMFISF